MATGESIIRRGIARKALAFPLAVALAAGLAPTPAFAVDTAAGTGLQAAELQDTQRRGSSLSTMAITTASLYSDYLPVLFRAANGMGEFAEDYQASGASQWAPEYFLFDVGNDGAPELFVRTTTFGGNKVVHAFTAKSGKLVGLGSYLEGAFGTAGNDSGKLFVAGWNTERSYVNSVNVTGGRIVSKFVKSGKATAASPSKHVQVVTDYLSNQNASWLKASSVSDYEALKSDSKYSLTKAKVTVASGGAYTGKAKTPKVTVTFGGATLKQGTDYKVAYKNNTNAGTAAVVVTGIGNYKDTNGGSFTISKLSNPMEFTVAGKVFSYADVAKSAQSYKPVTFTQKAQGTVTYTNTSSAAVANVCSVNASTGVVTVKKGAAKGTYAVKMKVMAGGGTNYRTLTRAVGFTVTVK